MDIVQMAVMGLSFYSEGDHYTPYPLAPSINTSNDYIKCKRYLALAFRLTHNRLFPILRPS